MQFLDVMAPNKTQDIHSFAILTELTTVRKYNFIMFEMNLLNTLISPSFPLMTVVTFGVIFQDITCNCFLFSPQ